ncbi:MAG: hypothetical protein HZC44_12015 [Geobacter sp.]|nr:hypothetical protein [Geobacter sp.]
MSTKGIIPQQFNTKEICLSETIGVSRNCEYVRVCVPFAKGELFDTEPLQIVAPADNTLPVQRTILKKWHDGSVKWLLLDFAATVPLHERVLYRLVLSNGLALTVANPVSITKSSANWRVSTGVAEFIIDTKEFRPFRSITVSDKELLASGGASCLLGLEGSTLTPTVDMIVAETEGPIRALIRLEGRFGPDELNAPRFVCRIHFFAGSSHVMLDFTLLNPRAASHPRGLWDLGDSGSLLFKELALQFPLVCSVNSRIICSPEQGISSLQFVASPGGMRIYQESSGGENWNSPVHRTRDGNVRLRSNGYEITNGSETIAGGKRATPLVWSGEGDTGVSAVMPHFWQEFPKAFSFDADGLKIELFPGCSPDLHELQGGEQKTTTIYLDFAATPEGLAWARSPLVAAPSPETCHHSAVFSDLPPMQGGIIVADLVDQFVSPKELIDKREIVDEFGWRNFGDFYADHETIYHNGKEPLVSHYNNQYDGIGGLYRKFFATGEPKWGELAVELARHVQDIDIYHTDQDRGEYNRGLFWHTDHYLDAGLSTHRSCSKEHLTEKDPRICGGGPGAEHCYTSGLMYHYFQTGNPAFRNAVTDLAEWELRALTGPQTVFAVLKKSLNYIKLLRSKEDAAKVIFPWYPLTRGTGNAITACLDAFEVSDDNRFLAEAERLIQGALHPDDDIDARNLLDAEIAWSYTVLLNALTKYLHKKRELEQYDEGYNYALASFLAYAEWMLAHEYPYLEKPEILEYPNETWAAQDLRKSVIFYYAAHYCSPDRSQKFLQRARFFFEAAANELAKHKSSCFTRPVILMLQNGWVGSRLSVNAISSLHDKGRGESTPFSGPPTPYLNFGSVVCRIASELLAALRQTSINREFAWLKARIN